MVGEQKVVVGREADQLAAGLPQGDVAIGVAEMRGLGQVEIADPRVVEPLDRLRCAGECPVSDNQKLEIAECLVEDGFNSQPDNIRPAVRRHQNGNAWTAHHPVVFPKL
ncbi:hypothetical protein GGR00_002904 [Aminobacter aganoensis]|uniref:Uncharacterized protein n=1 Tax=Aminobacter aganoensis TaxID=83264 RepID=A0A7X0F8S8_9HYPH|nr:hypothetical protein [Aminobacter aganoensis]